MKTARPSPITGVSLPVGNHPGNTGGKKGRSGRKPKNWGAFLKGLRDSETVQQAVQRAAEDETSRGFQPVLRLLADYDAEKPAAKSDVTSAGKPISGVVVLPSPTED